MPTGELPAFVAVRANGRALTGLVQLNRQVIVHFFGKSTEAMVLPLVPD